MSGNSTRNIFDEFGRLGPDEERLEIDAIPGIDRSELVLEEVSVHLAEHTPGAMVHLRNILRALDRFPEDVFAEDLDANLDAIFG